MKIPRWIIIAVALFAAWLAAEILLQRRTVPPQSVTDLRSFLNWQPAPRRIQVIEQRGTEYLLAMGQTGGVLASGPSGYVFDRTGRLVDWSSDIGDDSGFQKRWAPYSHRTQRVLEPGEALEWVDEVPDT